MKNIEYTKMAYLYDDFYSKKDYSKEVNFIKHFAKKETSKILDAGCGTGRHSKILFDNGFFVKGFDLSEDMVNIANSKIPDHFFVDNLLHFSSTEKFDLVVSFFAVFNHLKNYKEFGVALLNLKNALNKCGTIIIDLHNPQASGTKTEKINAASRTMTWRKCRLFKKEYTKITYIVDGKRFETQHTFKIFEIKKLKSLALRLGFSSVNFYENYNIEKQATSKSKNIQMVVSI